MDIQHNTAARRFEALVDAQRCVCDYRIDEREREVMFTHTYVPPGLRGHGVAAALVEAALTWARDAGLRVVPACSYVRVYMRRHPQWQALMADENP